MKKKLLVLLLMVVPMLTFAQEKGLDQKIDAAFKPVSDFFSNLIFFTIPIAGIDVPFVLLLLVGSALFFTIYFKFPNIFHFKTAINVVRGKYDELDQHEAGDPALAIGGDIKGTIKDESTEGEVTHFQALATAVSGTVGNGNIAGVALAIALGGPGATFWMVVCGFLGMSTKFVECTLGVQYRDVGEDGTVYGGPMYYISKGLKERGFKTFGKIVAIIFAIFCIGGSFGGGNAAQSNQATVVLKELMGLESSGAGFWIGVVMAVVVGVIIIGGIKRIASVTEKVVPFMAVLYLLACLYILGANFSLIDDAFSLIFREAFNPTAIGVGGVIGVLLVGFKRAAFSNEAGAGSASIAHSAVKTKYSASEGLVALLEPFIDTVVICTMTALVIIIFNFGGDASGATIFQYGGDGAGAVLIDGVSYEGAGITSKAFAEYIPYSNVFLTVAVVLFAVSTMISWSYYGLQSWKFLFGRGKAADMAYKLLFLLFVIIGASASMNSIWAFSDAMIFAMVFPNMVGLYFLFPVVKKQLKRYTDAIKESHA
ncbi:alanine:cation symporter family protein [Flavobacteriaceae bacterium]|jgi:AGCS family alanine or glycine:cation symporter|nr:alanine:cation symporter family protein [Flavobacteriaceae bacterium]MDB9780681.1 alanine:cation symporter family protein [Flavobacteriaceae bacterium]MDB9928541.1 alanine:cation symporter family protein [Flavobacteriaceae bacterium]MDC1343544.1 alanine:cation symporter family protein [Flavobacteriaceae bacterium]